MEVRIWFDRIVIVEAGKAEVLLGHTCCFNKSFNAQVMQRVKAERVSDFFNCFIGRNKLAASGEINRRLQDPDAVIDRIRKKYTPLATGIDHTDGLSLDLGSWRFNLRKSNTEPVVRLNVESRGDQGLMAEKTAEILAMLDA